MVLHNLLALKMTLSWLRRLIRLCRHSWKVEEMTPETEVLSAREFAQFRCIKCSAFKFRKR